MGSLPLSQPRRLRWFCRVATICSLTCKHVVQKKDYLREVPMSTVAPPASHLHRSPPAYSSPLVASRWQVNTIDAEVRFHPPNIRHSHRTYTNSVHTRCIPTTSDTRVCKQNTSASSQRHTNSRSSVCTLRTRACKRLCCDACKRL